MSRPYPRRITVLGAGLMGHSIAQALAAGGHSLRVWDPSAAALASLADRIQLNLSAMDTHDSVALAILGRIAPVAQFEDAVADAEIVIEAAPESLELKRALLARVEARADPDVAIWTNTSVIRIGDIGAELARPARLIGAHWWNPAHLIPLVELVPGPASDSAVLEDAEVILSDVGKTVVRLRRDTPGFIGNRLQFALVREALQLIGSGVCDAATIDVVVRHSFALRLPGVGPMENCDFIGLDLVRSIFDYLGPELSTEASPAVLVELVEQGRLGARTGHGLLDWVAGQPADVSARLAASIERNRGEVAS